MEKKQPLVEVIILNLNGKNNLDRCLNSLKESSYTNLRITVVDQNSTDGSRELIKKNYQNINLVKNDKNNGFVGGNNQILKNSKAEYCLLLNNDTEIDKKTISELVKIAERDERIAALQPKIKSLRNKKMFEYAGAAGCYLDIYGYPICRGRVFFDIEEDKGQYEDLREVFWCCGVAMFLRMSVLRKVGYLDRDFFAYSEEMDLSWRMNLAGHKQVYVPSSIVYHFGSATSGGDKSDIKGDKSSFLKVFLLHRNIWITVLKNYSMINWFRIIPMRIFLETIAILRFFPTQPIRAKAIAKANLFVLLNITKIIKKNKEISRIRVVSDKEIMRKMIKRSVILGYFLLGNNNFKHYVKYFNNFEKLAYKKR